MFTYNVKARALHRFWPPLNQKHQMYGIDIQLIYKLSIEVQSELIPGPATVVIQMDSE